MMKLHPKYLSGLAAVGIYVAVIGLVFFYFGYRSEKKSTHFVAKNSDAIAVTLQAPKSRKSKPKKTAKPKPKTQKTKPTKPKAIKAPKPAKVKPTKPAKKKPVKKKPVKKIKAKSLFSNIKSKPKPKPKSPKKPAKTQTPSTQTTKAASKTDSQKTCDALKHQQARDKGIENRYLASVQEKLYNWPAQSNFAGATFTIGLTIHPNGHFEYVVLTPSDNPEFNRTIEQYLKQLQGIGFDPTPKGKKYEFKVEIVAK